MVAILLTRFFSSSMYTMNYLPGATRAVPHVGTVWAASGAHTSALTCLPVILQISLDGHVQSSLSCTKGKKKHSLDTGMRSEAAFSDFHASSDACDARKRSALTQFDDAGF